MSLDVKQILDRSGEFRLRAHSFGELLRAAFVGHFVLCSFVGMFPVWFMAQPFIRKTGLHVPAGWIVVGCLLNGAILTGVTWLFHRFWTWRYAYGLHTRKAGGVLLTLAFLSGALDVFCFLVPWALAGLTLLTIVLVVHHIRAFGHRAVRILRPDAYPGWEDIGYLFHVFLTLLAAFTLINATLAVFAFNMKFQAFSFQGETHLGGLIDALYFTIGTMTTLGFGDIYPVSAVAKLVVALECLTSYFVFALMIGILTKGILPEGGKVSGGGNDSEKAPRPDTRDSNEAGPRGNTTGEPER